MKAVFCFLEDGVGMEFEDFLTDLLATIGRQTVEHDVTIGGTWPMDSQTSVLMTWASLVASAGLSVIVTFAASSCAIKSAGG